MRKSRIKRELATGAVLPCVKLNLNDPRIVEVAGLVGYPCIWVCNEHVPGGWLEIENTVRAAKVHDIDVIVRVEKGSYSDYIKAFECDAAAIMVPHVTSADEAREIVNHCRFMPLGQRPADGGNVDGAFTLIPFVDYIKASNEEKLIILQIESPEAVAVVDEIAAVEGYDFLLFGPGDYAHRIGRPGEIHAPEVLEARRKVEEAAKRHGKLLFGVGVQHLTPAELKAQGYHVANLTSDVGQLSAGLSKTLQAFTGVPGPSGEGLYR